jgi:hypothetical protein
MADEHWKNKIMGSYDKFNEERGTFDEVPQQWFIIKNADGSLDCFRSWGDNLKIAKEEVETYKQKNPSGGRRKHRRRTRRHRGSKKCRSSRRHRRSRRHH